MERVLGTPALFATAYGNVGSSIYYALGLTAVFALGLTPLVFLIAGIVFAATAATYAEGTVRFPEAGGSSSFARHGFNELVSFGAAWAQMLVYIVTIAASAFFVPHYLSIFWEPLNPNPWDIVGGAIVIVVLVALNTVGVQEAANLSISARGDRLRDAGTARRCSASPSSSARRPRRQRPLGHGADLGRTSRSRSRSRCSPTRVSRPSRTSPRRRASPSGRSRTRTSSSRVAVFAIYFTLPLIALSALPVMEIDGELTTLLALPPEEGGYANDPDPRARREPRGRGAVCSTSSQIYVGMLAATILFIATNAGIIGASRITYSMATYRQMPEVFRRLHPRFKTPFLALILFAGIAPIVDPHPGRRQLRRNALLARRDPVVHRRACRAGPVADAAGPRVAYRARPEPPPRRRRLAALRRLRRHRDRRLVPRHPRRRTRSRAGSGSAGSSVGLVGYAVYRRRWVRRPADARRSRRRRRSAPRSRSSTGGSSSRRPRPAVRRRARRRVQPRGRARRPRRRAVGARGATRAATRRRARRRGARRERGARRGDRDRRLLRRPRGGAAGPRPQRLRRDRARGRAPRRRDHRARLAAEGPDRAAGAASSARPSTASCARRRAA